MSGVEGWTYLPRWVRYKDLTSVIGPKKKNSVALSPRANYTD
jgi:hypothetical protein